VIITKLQVAPVELDVSSQSSQSSSSCRASRASRARRVERVELCSSTSSTHPKCMGSTRRTCRVVSSRDESSRVEPSGIWPYGSEQGVDWKLLQALFSADQTRTTKVGKQHTLKRQTKTNPTMGLPHHFQRYEI